VALVESLARPDAKIAPLLFAADAAMSLGAARVGLIAPYLCYMRQDRRFQPGEAITSRSFARLVSESFDWLVTVDPHLHRYKSLGEIYAIPAAALHAGPLLADWIKAHVRQPVIVGPDAESAQWVSAVAGRCGAPWRVLDKQRQGDRSVIVAPPRDWPIAGAATVLVDDIVSSGETIAQAARVLGGRPLCVAIHAVLADGAAARLADAGVKLVATDSIPGPFAAIPLPPLIAPAVSRAASDQE
jgi:ribose-phosphate pyrophosphokinase